MTENARRPAASDRPAARRRTGPAGRGPPSRRGSRRRPTPPNPGSSSGAELPAGALRLVHEPDRQADRLVARVDRHDEPRRPDAALEGDRAALRAERPAAGCRAAPARPI